MSVSSTQRYGAWAGGNHRSPVLGKRTAFKPHPLAKVLQVSAGSTTPSVCHGASFPVLVCSEVLFVSLFYLAAALAVSVEWTPFSLC